MASVNAREKALLYSVFTFLIGLKEKSGVDGENIDVAVQCLSEACGVNVNDVSDTSAYSIESHGLSEIFQAGVDSLGITIGSTLPDCIANDPAVVENVDLWKKWEGKLNTRGFFNNLTPGTPEYEARYQKALQKFKEKFCNQETSTTEASNEFDSLSAEDREAKAEEFKIQGNGAISGQQYQDAVDFYAKAIQCSPTGPKSHIYYANQAAAYTHLQKYDQVIQCCEKAIELMPSYSKSYSRLGFAHIQLQDYDAAIDAYRRGLEYDPNNQACTEGLAEAESKNQQVSSRGAPAGMGGPGGMPDMSNLASMLGGAGGGGLAGLMNNPAMRQMAEGMMQNPQMMQMAQNMMQNPEMMQNMMGSLGGGGGGAPGGGGGPAGLLNPETMSRLQNSPELAALKEDPELQGFFRDLESGNVMAAMGHMSNPVVAEKLNKVISQLS